MVRRVWLFDLDNTLHDASHAALPAINTAMSVFIAEQLALPLDEADALRTHYWRRYGATLQGLVRHHGVGGAHFLEHTRKRWSPWSRCACSAHTDPSRTRRMRFVLARLKVAPAHCTLVEDTLEHQRAARSLRIRTVWMRRYLRSTAHPSKVSVHRCAKPPSVCARIKSLQTLRTM